MSDHGGWGDSYEINVLHPATADWLTEHGYIYQYEAMLPIRGQIDFWATDAAGCGLLVECKPSLKQFEKTIKQVQKYWLQFNDGTKAAIALPCEVAKGHAQEVCARSNIIVIPVNVPHLVTYPVDISSEWERILRRDMVNTGQRSMSSYLRRLVAERIEEIQQRTTSSNGHREDGE